MLPKLDQKKQLRRHRPILKERYEVLEVHLTITIPKKTNKQFQFLLGEVRGVRGAVDTEPSFLGFVSNVSVVVGRFFVTFIDCLIWGIWCSK